MAFKAARKQDITAISCDMSERGRRKPNLAILARNCRLSEVCKQHAVCTDNRIRALSKHISRRTARGLQALRNHIAINLHDLFSSLRCVRVFAGRRRRRRRCCCCCRCDAPICIVDWEDIELLAIADVVGVSSSLTSPSIIGKTNYEEIGFVTAIKLRVGTKTHYQRSSSTMQK
jgi:hypothetical protein